MNLLQLSAYWNQSCKYQAESGNMFDLQSTCSRDQQLYNRVRLCDFEIKWEDLRINGAENCDGVWLSQSLCHGGGYESARFTGLHGMGHTWWRNAELLTWLKVSALIANFVDSHQSTSRNMLSPRNRLARVTSLHRVDLPTRT